MERLHRIAIAGLIAAGIAMAAHGVVWAQQKFPTKPIRLVVASSPGSPGDILARLIGSKMGESWGQPVVNENRTGGLGAIAATLVAKAAPDGHTLLLVSPAFAIRAALGAKAVNDLIALAKAKPGKLLFGSAGAGSATHLNGERFLLAAGIKAQHVGFKGQAEFQLEIVAGRIHFGSTSVTAALPFILDGRLVALALAQRTPLVPGVPTMAEALPGWSRDGTQAILAPAGTPLPIRRQISKEVVRILDLPDIRERLQAVSFNIAPSTPEEHDRNLRNDIAVFSKVVRDAGLRPR